MPKDQGRAEFLAHIARHGQRNQIRRGRLQTKDGGHLRVEEREDAVRDPSRDLRGFERLRDDAAYLGEPLRHPSAPLALPEQVCVPDRDGGVGGEERQEPQVVLGEDPVGRGRHDQGTDDLRARDQGHPDRRLVPFLAEALALPAGHGETDVREHIR